MNEPAYHLARFLPRQELGGTALDYGHCGELVVAIDVEGHEVSRTVALPALPAVLFEAVAE
jgi:hypothetical protein